MVRLEREDDDATVRPAREERVGVRVELQLADEGRVALQEGDQVAVCVVALSPGESVQERQNADEDENTMPRGAGSIARTHPSWADQTRTVESSEPVTTRSPSNATE